MNNEARLKAELSVVRAAVKAGLDKGYSVSVNDGEEWTLNKSRKITEIMAALRTTDEDAVVFYAADGSRLGFMQFVYGNEPYEVICDYADRPAIEELYRMAEIVADRVEARCRIASRGPSI